MLCGLACQIHHTLIILSMLCERLTLDLREHGTLFVVASSVMLETWNARALHEL